MILLKYIKKIRVSYLNKYNIIKIRNHNKKSIHGHKFLT